jgi:hypothetical protein
MQAIEEDKEEELGDRINSTIHNLEDEEDKLQEEEKDGFIDHMA